MNPYYAYVIALIAGAPFVAVAVTGLVLAVMRRSHHPRASALAAFGFSALAVNALVAPAVRVYVSMGVEPGGSLAARAAHIGLMSAFVFVLNLGGIVLITCAVFANRGRPSNAA
jgi:hypothetical protein